MYGWLHVAAIETVVSETDIFVSPTDNFNIINLDQLFGVGALAHRGLPPFIGGLCGDHFPHRTTMTQAHPQQIAERSALRREVETLSPKIVTLVSIRRIPHYGPQ